MKEATYLHFTVKIGSLYNTDVCWCYRSGNVLYHLYTVSQHNIPFLSPTVGCYNKLILSYSLCWLLTCKGSQLSLNHTKAHWLRTTGSKAGNTQAQNILAQVSPISFSKPRKTGSQWVISSRVPLAFSCTWRYFCEGQLCMAQGQEGL